MCIQLCVYNDVCIICVYNDVCTMMCIQLCVYNDVCIICVYNDVCIICVYNDVCTICVYVLACNILECSIVEMVHHFSLWCTFCHDDALILYRHGGNLAPIMWRHI